MLTADSQLEIRACRTSAFNGNLNKLSDASSVKCGKGISGQDVIQPFSNLESAGSAKHRLLIDVHGLASWAVIVYGHIEIDDLSGIVA